MMAGAKSTPDGWTGTNLVVVGNMSVINCERKPESSVLIYSKCQAVIIWPYLIFMNECSGIRVFLVELTLKL